MKDTPTELHILNGDFALELWKQCDFKGQCLVWRETYIEGPLPATDDLHVFRKARAEYLSHFTELAYTSQTRLYQYLKKLDESILHLPDASTLMLWFDSCIFDQTLLMRILYLLSRKKPGTVRVFLYCCEGNTLQINDFKLGITKKVQLLPEDLKVAGKAWLLFQCKDAEGMMQFASRENFERLPKLKKALLRCAEEVPDKNGLTRTRRQILQLVSEGHHTFTAIFKGLDSLEEYPFLGDTACQRHLEHLISEGRLMRRGDRYELP